MLGGLVEYENSDGEEVAEEEEEEVAGGREREAAAEGENGAAGAIISSSDDDDDADDSDQGDKDEGGGGINGLAALAAADDTVEESLRMRVPASALPTTAAASTSATSAATTTAAAPATTRTPVLPPNPHLAGIVRQKQQQQKRRLIILDAGGGGANNSSDEDDDDEDAVKRRRVVAAASGQQLRGATSLLARLPKPKALAVREGASRVFIPPQAVRKTAAAAAAAASSVPMTALPSVPVHEVHVTEADDEAPPASRYEQLAQQQQQLLGVPPSEMHRYRQATGASLTADVAAGSGGGGIIDIRQADQVAGSDIELAKDLTRNAGADPRRKPAGPAPSSMDKRKHQITYLAYQAQERELELKNSWADSRFSKRATQNKYGF